MVKTKQDEGYKTGMCLRVTPLCYYGNAENKLNIINFFDKFKENSSNKFKMEANMFSESR